MSNTLAETLTLTESFDQAMQGVLAECSGDGSPRAKVTGIFMTLSLDHWQAVRTLFAHDKPASAFALLRCQYEATVRAFWFHFAASDEKVQRFGSVQAEDGVLKEPTAKTIAQMIASMAGRAPAQVCKQLQEFNDSSLKPLNSYVHGGHYAMVSTALGELGVPEAHRVMVLRHSNGLAGMIAMLSGVGSGDVALTQRVVQVQLAHLPCMPEMAKDT
jgi:hypothetical protein